MDFTNCIFLPRGFGDIKSFFGGHYRVVEFARGGKLIISAQVGGADTGDKDGQ